MFKVALVDILQYHPPGVDTPPEANQVLAVVSTALQQMTASWDATRLEQYTFPIFIKDQALRYVYLNQSARNEFPGVAEWIGKSDEEIGWEPPHQTAIYRTADEKILTNGGYVDLIETITAHAMTKHWRIIRIQLLAHNRRWLGGIFYNCTQNREPSS